VHAAPMRRDAAAIRVVRKVRFIWMDLRWG